PAPNFRPAVGTNPKDESEIERPVTSDGPPSLFIYKTLADPFAGKLSLFRVFSGTVKGDTNLVNVRRENQA
ncbi:MAG: hypothetical protein GWN46_12860, partial [Gammaproteobacteria bacterium]|nr:hypothetical protein [Gammaproteobacteria bacterium]